MTTKRSKSPLRRLLYRFDDWLREKKDFRYIWLLFPFFLVVALASASYYSDRSNAEAVYQNRVEYCENRLEGMVNLNEDFSSNKDYIQAVRYDIQVFDYGSDVEEIALFLYNPGTGEYILASDIEVGDHIAQSFYQKSLGPHPENGTYYEDEGAYVIRWLNTFDQDEEWMLIGFIDKALLYSISTTPDYITTLVLILFLLYGTLSAEYVLHTSYVLVYLRNKGDCCDEREKDGLCPAPSQQKSGLALGREDGERGR